MFMPVHALLIGLSSALLQMASSSGVPACIMQEAPQIHVLPRTSGVSYDFSKTAKELEHQSAQGEALQKSGRRRVVGGLHVDRPVYEEQITFSYTQYPSLGLGCLGYKNIAVNITLAPKIFVAREFNKRGCREEVLKHERRHNRINRDMVNKYALEIGKAVEEVVNKTGVIGPFLAARAATIQKNMQILID